MLTRDQQTTYYRKVGENIRSLREALNIKQESLAQVLGLTRISISNIEKGKQRIQLHALIEAANYLKTSPTALLPSMDLFAGELSSKLEKKISNTEIGNDVIAVEKIKDFIKLSKNKK